MRAYRTIIFPSVAALYLSLGAIPLTAQGTPQTTATDSQRWYSPSRYNPVKWFKTLKNGSKPASEELAANGDLEKKLTKQLEVQGIVPQGTDLKDECSSFKSLAECVAAIRVSHNLSLEFNCLKWDVTGVKPKRVGESCAGPLDDKAMGLQKSIELLKAGADAKVEARNALQRARNDINDAKP